jgi:riboflavin biosynthesis pyrimidine reductase
MGDALRRLAALDILTLLVEGGPAVHAALWADGLVDHLAELVADDVLGADGVPTRVTTTTPHLRQRRIVPLGRDVLMEGDVHRID